MSVLEDVWKGKDGGSRAAELEWDYTKEDVDQSLIHYMPKMRWNKNVKQTREKECWVCGVVTSKYYSHVWRVQQGGRVPNIKCEHCYGEYIKKKADKGV